MQGPAPNPMVPGCSPIPLLDEHRYIHTTLAQAFLQYARGSPMTESSDVEGPQGSLSLSIAMYDSGFVTIAVFLHHRPKRVDRDGDDQPLRTIESGYLRFDPDDCKIPVDFSCN